MFLDNERHNLTTTAKIGVTGVYTPDGVTHAGRLVRRVPDVPCPLRVDSEYPSIDPEAGAPPIRLDNFINLLQNIDSIRNHAMQGERLPELPGARRDPGGVSECAISRVP